MPTQFGSNKDASGADRVDKSARLAPRLARLMLIHALIAAVAAVSFAAFHQPTWLLWTYSLACCFLSYVLNRLATRSPDVGRGR
jgi:hypothetical protein